MHEPELEIQNESAVDRNRVKCDIHKHTSGKIIAFKEFQAAAIAGAVRYIHKIKSSRKKKNKYYVFCASLL